MNKRIGDWIETWSGISFYPLDPRPEEILIEDIARGLSLQCRYVGQIKFHYSIAQHCVLLHDAIEDQHKKQILLHDGSEAYICDIPSPIKPYLTNYKSIENNLQTMIYVKYGIDPIEHPRVKEFDKRILLDEKQVLKTNSNTNWNFFGGPLGITIEQWSPEKAYDEFLNRFRMHW